MSTDEDALIAQFAKATFWLAVTLSVPWWVPSHFGLFGTWEIVVDVAWFALLAVIWGIAMRRAHRRWQERWVWD